MMDEFITIEKIGIVGVLLYVGDRLFKIIEKQKEKNNGNGESQMREISRDKIVETHIMMEDVQERQKKMMPDQYRSMGKAEDVHDIVTAKSESGAPKVYNPELHNAINGLKIAVNRLADK